MHAFSCICHAWKHCWELFCKSKMLLSHLSEHYEVIGNKAFSRKFLVLFGRKQLERVKISICDGSFSSGSCCFAKSVVLEGEMLYFKIPFISQNLVSFGNTAVNIPELESRMLGWLCFGGTEFVETTDFFFGEWQLFPGLTGIFRSHH